MFEECRFWASEYNSVNRQKTNILLNTIGYKFFDKGNGCHLVKTKSEYNIIQSIQSPCITLQM